jgi:hypothetical protein
VLLRKVRFALAPFVVWRALEVALGIAVLWLAVPVLLAHPGDPRYLAVTGALVVFTTVVTVLCALLLVHGLQLDYGGPVTRIQRQVEHLRLLAYRAFKWALLGGVICWLPRAPCPARSAHRRRCSRPRAAPVAHRESGRRAGRARRRAPLP